MFAFRTYNYDPNLLWLLPPWFPTVDKPYTVLLQRELHRPRDGAALKRATPPTPIGGL